MARRARIVVPDYPLHVTQRGHRQQQVFFSADDYLLFRRLLRESCARLLVQVWAYCFMPNHIHLIVTPKDHPSLAEALGQAFSSYAIILNRRLEVTGYFWQNRYYSCLLDQSHLQTATRYVELNPVRAGLVARAEDWPWSSARAHLEGQDDELVRVQPLLHMWPDWEGFLQQDVSSDELDAVRCHVKTGRPLGSAEFVLDLERMTGRKLSPGRRGRRPRLA